MPPVFFQARYIDSVFNKEPGRMTRISEWGEEKKKKGKKKKRKKGFT